MVNLVLIKSLNHIFILELLSVMEKLPPTSYLRLVDIWLITTQLTPFLLVALTTTIEFFEKDDFHINHHGLKRYMCDQ